MQQLVRVNVYVCIHYIGDNCVDRADNAKRKLNVREYMQHLNEFAFR